MPVPYLHKNFSGITTVAVAPSPALSGVTLTVATGDGAAFATPTATQFFPVIIWPSTGAPSRTTTEVALATALSGDVFTLTRNWGGGGINRTILVGDQFSANITSEWMTQIETAASSRMFAMFVA